MQSRPRIADNGMTTIEYVVASALSLLLLVVMVNVILVLYARGVVHSALDEGVRAGAPSRLSPVASVAACNAKAHEVIDGLLSGSLGAKIRIDCALNGDGVVTAHAVAEFDPWIPGTMPTWTFEPRASARKDE
jgi:hypothetical protein